MAENHGDGDGDEADQEADKNWVSTLQKKPKTVFTSHQPNVCERVCIFERKCQICMFTLP